MTILDGKTLSQEVMENIKVEVLNYKKNGIVPGLAVILVGDNPASLLYVNMKTKACERVGIYSINHRLPKEITEGKLLSVIRTLNENPMVHGILIQLPLPEHIDENRVLEEVAPCKDVDGFHPYNIGRLARGNPCFTSCTALGIMKLLEAYSIEVKGKDVVIVGAGNMTGKPMALLLLNQNATVQVCHIFTANLRDKIAIADIVISAVGKNGLINGDMIKERAVVIDVGIKKMGDRVVGDVDFESVSPKASFITPVPGGVGPMTIAMLLHNTLKAVSLSLSS
ncbi:MAG: bifunctional methylenetetrahydrofolate dehydrogenase/methenyltetrahydrofolate cyclohydrolase FolD [Campylobacterota bacterium]|nr:bifunctional methylenetetrahydrofolate dehydrogenase/methenyltetrahydrofolate cyclohydrolase FolD [Campylobacterota bacterium]